MLTIIPPLKLLAPQSILITELTSAARGIVCTLVGSDKAASVDVVGDVIIVDADDVSVITANGIIYTKAVDPQNPKPGEFVFNPYNKTIVVSWIGAPTSSIQIVGEIASDIQVIPPLIKSPYPDLFTKIPLQGSFRLDRGFEQHPSGSFEFETTLPRQTIINIFQPGLEIDVYGIPLRINSLPIIKEFPISIYPDGRIAVSVSFGGRWENYSDTEVFLRNDGSNVLSAQPYQDPDCSTGTPKSSEPRQSETTVAALLAKLRINYVGYTLKNVEISRDTPKSATVQPFNLLSERARVARGFLFYSNPAGVEIKRINSTHTWTYSEGDIIGEIDCSYEAIDKSSKRRIVSFADINPPQPDLINFPGSLTPAPVFNLRSEGTIALAYEYPNVELTGKFSEDKDEDQSETTQGSSIPRWRKKEPKRETRVDGLPDANKPLAGVRTIKAMSLCFDLGGETKEVAYNETENGTPIRTRRQKWGFAFTADSIYNSASKNLAGNPTEEWRCIEDTTLEYKYEPKTGYLLATYETGYTTVRYKQESADNPETLTLKTDDPEYGLYRFFRIPVWRRTGYFLKLQENYSNDDAYEISKRCKADGSSEAVLIPNPNFAPPYYSAQDLSQSNAFARRANPANQNLGREDKRMPDLIVGECSWFQSNTTTIPAIYEETYRSDSKYVTLGKELTPQKFFKYNTEFKAQGAAINSALAQSRYDEGTGNPSTHTRRNDLYEKEENSKQEPKPQKKSNKLEYRYLLQTQGYRGADPISGSINFAVAETEFEALEAARVDLAIKNWQAGFKETINIPANFNIQEGDLFFYFCKGEYRRRVVLGVSHNLDILGVVDGAPRITGMTTLNLGFYRLPSMNYTKTLVPKPPEAPKYNLNFLNVVDKTLSEFQDWNGTISRRNF